MADDDEIMLSPDDAQAAWAGTLRGLAGRARARAEKRAGQTLAGPVRVISMPNDFEFQRYIGARVSHVVAVAQPQMNRIVVLRPVLFAQSPAEQELTLTHEVAHLLIAQRVPGRLPAWLEEGLCMMIAGQEGLGYSWRMTVAGSLGGTLPLRQMEESLLGGGDLQSLAYAQGLSMTRFFIRTTLADHGRRGESPAALLDLLADPNIGPGILSNVTNPYWAAGFEARWKREHKSVWNWIAIGSGASVVWLFMTFLFLLAYWRKKRMNKLKREAFDNDDEPWSETEEEE